MSWDPYLAHWAELGSFPIPLGLSWDPSPSLQDELGPFPVLVYPGRIVVCSAVTRGDGWLGASGAARTHSGALPLPPLGSQTPVVPPQPLWDGRTLGFAFQLGAGEVLGGTVPCPCPGAVGHLGRRPKPVCLISPRAGSLARVFGLRCLSIPGASCLTGCWVLAGVGCWPEVKWPVVWQGLLVTLVWCGGQ